MRPKPTLDKETQQLITGARTLGTTGLSISLEDAELIRVCAVIAVDLGRQDLLQGVIPAKELPSSYYGTPLEWFERPGKNGATFLQVFTTLRDAVPDFATYFKCLCELHKRRLKFQMVLQYQPIARLEQIVPKCLLEFGLRPPEALASWLVWRKWLYDIDNRSAQETGYLFEPILAAAIGGVPYSARKSPVKRAGDATKGRQVDCLDGKLAYEFKMRVTIAASGQGRFREELDFAQDCRHSGFTPMLLVLDPTPSSRLDDLAAEFKNQKGKVYTGPGAWAHIEKRAGRVMGLFVERYVRIPLQQVDSSYGELLPIGLANEGSRMVVEVGEQAFVIKRPAGEEPEVPGLEDESEVE